jgi:hypothetical protein
MDFVYMMYDEMDGMREWMHEVIGNAATWRLKVYELRT